MERRASFIVGGKLWYRESLAFEVIELERATYGQENTLRNNQTKNEAMLDLVHSQVYQSAQSNLHNVKQDQQVPIFYHNLQLLSSMVYHLDKNIQKLRSDAQ